MGGVVSYETVAGNLLIFFWVVTVQQGYCPLGFSRSAVH